MSVRMILPSDAPEMIDTGPLPGPPAKTTGGIWEVLKLAFPLILSSSAHAAKLFGDRLMLAWYDETALSASFISGLTAFLLIILLGGTAGYASVFVAQYTGAGRPERTGMAVWQALLFALVGGVVTAVGAFAAPYLFGMFRHGPLFQMAESSYYRTLCSGAVFTLLLWGIGSFWTGRNKPWTIVIVNGSSVLFNLLFNWFFIFGDVGCHRLEGTALAPVGQLMNALALWIDAPHWGIFGAAVATVGTEALSLAIYLLILFRGVNRRAFGTWPKRVFDRELMGRLVRFGSPAGMQGFLDVAAFTVFNHLMGNYAASVVAATTIAFSVNTLAFNPMLGLGMAVSILVGQAVGGKRIAHAKRSVRSARIILFTYMLVMSAWFFLAPETVAALFSKDSTATMAAVEGGADEIAAEAAAVAADPSETMTLAARFLRYIAIWLIFDSLFILYSSAIRGAGDTKFAMYMFLALGWGLFALPSLAAFYLFDAGYETLWRILLLYITVTGLTFYWRYRKGAWTRMRVIEG